MTKPVNDTTQVGAPNGSVLPLDETDAASPKELGSTGLTAVPELGPGNNGTPRMADIRLHRALIIHNHWIHYKHLLFKALLHQGMDFKVCFTAYHSSDRLRPEPRADLPYRHCLLDENSSYESASKLKCSLRLWKLLSRERPEVLVVSGWYDPVSWAAWLWGSAHRIRMVLWAESNHFDRGRSAWKEKLKSLFVKRFDAVHVYGQSNADYIARLGVPPGRIRTKRAVLDVRHFRLSQSPDRRQGPIELIYVGRFSPEKNLNRLVQALAEVHRQADVKLTLVGYGPQEQELRALVAAKGLGDRVTFRGQVNQEDLPEEYWRADAFILPSISEPWGLVANEAMCCGLPVALSTRCGCARDLVTHETGWTFDPFDTQQIAGVIRMIAATGRERLKEMGLSARRLSETYSPEHCARIVAQSFSGAEEIS